MDPSRRTPGLFAFGVRLFGIGLPLGFVIALLAPVEFVRWLGSIALVGSMLGLALSLAGLRLDSATRPRPIADDIGPRFGPHQQPR